MLLNASVPDRTSIQIDSFTAEAIPDLASPLTDPLYNQWKRCVIAGKDNPDCLVQSGPGRYLWLRLTFNSNGSDSPELRSLKVFYPRVSYLQYLPAVYQEDENSRLFLERFLSIFQSEFDDLDRKIDGIWQLFNPGLHTGKRPELARELVSSRRKPRLVREQTPLDAEKCVSGSVYAWNRRGAYPGYSGLCRRTGRHC